MENSDEINASLIYPEHLIFNQAQDYFCTNSHLGSLKCKESKIVP